MLTAEQFFRPKWLMYSPFVLDLRHSVRYFILLKVHGSSKRKCPWKQQFLAIFQIRAKILEADFALPAEKTGENLIFDARPPDLLTICALTQPPDLRMRIARKSYLGLANVNTC